MGQAGGQRTLWKAQQTKHGAKCFGDSFMAFVGSGEDWRAQHSPAGSCWTERRCCGREAAVGAAAPSGWKSRVSPHKALHANSNSCKTNTPFQAWSSQINNRGKKASHLTSFILGGIFSNLLQYGCRGASKPIHGALPEGCGNHSYATGLAKASALFSPATLSALLVLSAHRTNFTQSNKSPASGNHSAGIRARLCGTSQLPAPRRRWLPLPCQGLGLRGTLLLWCFCFLGCGVWNEIFENL